MKQCFMSARKTIAVPTGKEMVISVDLCRISRKNHLL